MVARLAPVLVLACASLLPSRLGAQERKYDVKSGIITYETSTLEGRVQIAGRIILYFDQYGRLECKDTYVNGMLKESVLCDGKTVYTVWHEKRIVFKRGPASYGTEVRFDTETLPAGEKSEGHIKMLPPMTLAGITCVAFERITPAGVVTFAGADHILMYCERILKEENWVMKAVSVDEKSVIPASKFVPPAGYAERETHF
ncbi:MAG TPA: hypothetical protein VK569_10905 [Bacteroidota bacterium]|nr:hypothetical protein [Bacteroidota bacterium]